MSYTYSDQLFSDFHKEAYGTRPSQGMMRRWDEFTPDEKQEVWEELESAANRRWEEETIRQQRAVEMFEANVQNNMMVGAPDRETAIRWIIQSLDPDEFDLRYGGSWVCWELGLPFSMQADFDPIVKEML